MDICITIDEFIRQIIFSLISFLVFDYLQVKCLVLFSPGIRPWYHDLFLSAWKSKRNKKPKSNTNRLILLTLTKAIRSRIFKTVMSFPLHLIASRITNVNFLVASLPLELASSTDFSLVIIRSRTVSVIGLPSNVSILMAWSSSTRKMCCVASYSPGKYLRKNQCKEETAVRMAWVPPPTEIWCQGWCEWMLASKILHCSVKWLNCYLSVF
jgi:hypothetical protein